MNLIPYLTFNGNCEDAMNFYKKCLDGEIIGLQYFEAAQGMPVPESHKKKVMHSTLKFGNSTLMASDTMPDNSYAIGSNVSLSVDEKDFEKVQKSFNALAEGGKVTMPLQETFWGARFGMLTDKYGFRWMFNCDK
jgi:PhnB protein